jgi:hypothetical protein
MFQFAITSLEETVKNTNPFTSEKSIPQITRKTRYAVSGMAGIRGRSGRQATRTLSDTG